MTKYAAARAKLLLGCYRTGDANDPETYVAAVTAILARYPEEVITSVTHPATGLPSKKSWLPSIREVTDACDDAFEPIKQQGLREKRIAEQLAARESDVERPTREDLRAKYGKNYGIGFSVVHIDETPEEKNARWKAQVKPWDDVAKHYQARPGRVQWLADRLPVMRGDKPDTPEVK